MSTQESLAYFHGEELPASVFIDKYAARTARQSLLELEPDAMHWRLAREFARVDAKKFKEPLSAETIYSHLKEFGDIIPQGGVMAGAGASQYVSLSNCYVLESPEDSYGGIHLTDEQLTQISKRRGGVGTDLSHLRYKGALTTNSARSSSGVVSYARRYSASIREVGQNGRRGALMLTLSVHHPDVLEFIRMKLDSTEVTGANVSVRLTDEFMAAVDADAEYEQRWPCEGGEPTFRRMVKARTIWDEIINCAWVRAEPGVLFWDHILRESPADCYAKFGFRTISTNPCVTGDTWVMTTEGPRQVTDLLQDTFVAVVDGERHSCETGFFKTGVKPILEVETVGGFRFRCTADHRVNRVVKLDRHKRELDWTPASALQPGDVVSLHNHRPLEEWDGPGTFEEGWLVGSLLGDGCFSGKRARLSYWGEDRAEMRSHAAGLMKSSVACRVDVGSDRGGDGAATSTSSVSLARLAKRFGVGSDKTVGADAERSSSDFHRGFLRGWFDADGTVAKRVKGNSVRLNSSTLENLRVAQRMLARLGIISTIYQDRHPEQSREMPDGNGNSRLYETAANHDLHVSGDNLTRFKKLVGFAEPAKASKLAACVREYRRKPNRERFADRVLSVTPAGEEAVYDCTVEGVHEFDGNGVSLHNCGELPLCYLDSCRLLLLNLFSFVDKPFAKEAVFNWDRFRKVAGIAQRLMDDLIDLELECVARIIGKVKADPEPERLKRVELEMWEEIYRKCEQGRRTGTGITALGDAVAGVGLKFGTEEAVEFSEAVYRELKLACYRSSVDMAKELGPFPVFDAKLEKDCPFLLRIRDEDPALYADMQKYGRRNIALLTTAPAGSTSIVAGPAPYYGTTSSGEPLFTDAPYTRRKKITPGMADARVDFTDALGDQWTEFEVFHSKLRMWMDVTGESDWTKSPYHGATANDIDWTNRVKMQAAAQRHVDHSISSTVNLPNDVSREEVANIYLTAWKSLCKGMTVYRDGCRDGVLVHKKEAAPLVLERPQDVPCDIHHLSYARKPFVVVVGLLGGRPYEVFGYAEADTPELGDVKGGLVRKARKGVYQLRDAGGEVNLLGGRESLTGQTGPLEEALTRMVSVALRNNADLNLVVGQLEKARGDLTSFSRVLARALKKYLKDGEVKGEACEACSGKLVRQEGCVTCPSCGWSKCS